MSGNGAVLVTGASSGMGKACALRLSRGGFTVFAGVRKDRDAQALREGASSRLIPVMLDVTSEESIAQAFGTIRDAVGAAGLAGLLNNAGIAVSGPIELVPLQELRRQYEVNVFGQVAVTQAFLPPIRSARGRIVNIGSVGAKFALPFFGVHNSSKAAFESINDALRMELRRWGIRVILVSPGSIRTAAETKLVHDSEKVVSAFSAEGKALYAASYRAFIQSMLRLETHGAAPELVAETVYRALTARSPRRRYPVGPKSRLLPLLFTRLPPAAADALRLRIFHVAA
jgi:NAD(P)-dependent dehydrogenase (short-subunit alcohol dehydrogenase family)